MGRSLLQSIIDIQNPARYKYIIIDAEFYDRDISHSVYAVIDQLRAKKLVCCCYAPLTIRKERNLKDVEVRQCKAFELPPKGVFVDTSKPVAEILQGQILPLLASEPLAGPISPGSVTGKSV